MYALNSQTNVFKHSTCTDMAAIPDFVSGAMENWGLVTYREARLLYDNVTSSAATKRDIVNVICHEFAHMWFGNLGKSLHQLIWYQFLRELMEAVYLYIFLLQLLYHGGMIYGSTRVLLHSCHLKVQILFFLTGDLLVYFYTIQHL